MRIEIDISEEDYNIIKHNNAIDNPLCPLSQKEVVCIISNGMPVSEKQECALKEIEEEINSPNRGTCDYFIVDKIEEIINKYKQESEE